MKEGDFVNSLIKVANDMVDVTEQKASPEDVLNALQEIISQLEQVAGSIPAEQAPVDEEEAPQDGTIEGLKTEVAQLREKIAKKEREDIAIQYASLFNESQLTAKTDEVLKSDKGNNYWLAKIDGINEYAKSTDVLSHQAKSFSYQRVAKQGSDMYII